ncbi:hypothetical protein KCG44_04640 [Pacificimonas sp. WHA3]|uniref:FecR protein domain-containing protein n=1 Tax=Pacificimonas pallii TaxID=2827236 RepID=A0ABS6SCF6_9SPHN|nr:hypothetical protein [Pacificimonas pallii]MBV7256069.1 hypothetical protein [Pacificimonas pallii]
MSPRTLAIGIAVILFIVLAAGAVALKYGLGAASPASRAGAASASSAFLSPASASTLSANAPELPQTETVSVAGDIAASAGMWDEAQVTNRFWHRAQELAWQNKPVDFVDAKGRPQGSDAFARGSFGTGGRIRIDLPAGLNDIYVHASSGRASVHARESGQGPVLILDNGRRLSAIADADIEGSTVRTLGSQPVLHARASGGFLVRFPPYEGKGTLLLQQTDRGNKPGTLEIFKTDPQLPPLAQPATLPAAARRVLEITANTVADRRPERSRIEGEWKRTWLDAKSAPQSRCSDLGPGQCRGLTLLGDRHKLPAALKRAAVVTYFRIDGTWSSTGGKLPGLGNTGDTEPGNKTCLGDTCYPDAGWGGRRANGLRWHARGLFTGAGEDGAPGWGTYLYALNVDAGHHGKHLPAAEPLPRGEVVAAVQYISVNDVGADNGELGLWLCRPAGCTPMYWRDDIRYRTVDSDLALINEMDIAVYCGGMSCQMKPGTRFDYDFHSAAVFDGMPDLDAVAQRVSVLARTAPPR